MPFVYGVVGSAGLSCSGTPSTETINLALRQATRGFDTQAFYVNGRAAGLTSISGITFRARRWTTAGTGGTSLTPNPRRLGTTASTTAADSSAAITAGTVSGAYQVSFGCGVAGPGGWVAPNPDSAIHVEGGSSDELALNSLSGTASLTFDLSAEIAE